MPATIYVDPNNPGENCVSPEDIREAYNPSALDKGIDMAIYTFTGMKRVRVQSEVVFEDIPAAPAAG